MERYKNIIQVGNVLLLSVMIFLLLSGSSERILDTHEKMDKVSQDYSFDFFTWESATLWDKLWYSLLSPHRMMRDEEQSAFFLQYLDDVRNVQRLEWELQKIYADPEVADPEAASAEVQSDLSAMRARVAETALMAEAILQEQVSAVLVDGGFRSIPAILPPVLGSFTPLPTILVVSPRDTIASFHQAQLIAGLTAADRQALEEQIREAFPDYTAYVTDIGGLAAYPAMLLESSSLDWVADVMAHEWTHHYLMFAPLGWQYMSNGEARTINETTASLMGDWAGQEVVLRFYESFLERGKALPNPVAIVDSEESEPVTENGFDFRSEMRRTRVNVDAMLERGEIERAEWYMEAQRRYFVANGYNLRVLNQAYFAFHGAYADTPGGSGAAGKDPLGPSVREIWAMSETPFAFVRTMSPLTSLDAVLAQVPQ